MKHISESIIGRRGIATSHIELQDGDVVVLRDGSYTVTNIDTQQIHSQVPPGIMDRIILLKSYNPDLTHSRYKGWDIMTVYRFTDPDVIDPTETYRSSELESFVHRNLKGIIHYGINTVFERK